MQNKYIWRISKKLLIAILEDKVSDIFLSELIWDRLSYTKNHDSEIWIATKNTPLYWKEKYISSPLIISDRKASVYLTRSIPKEQKQGLKNFLGFKGYKIDELYPRRTRRATAINWLIFWEKSENSIIVDEDEMPNRCGIMHARGIPPMSNVTQVR